MIYIYISQIELFKSSGVFSFLFLYHNILYIVEIQSIAMCFFQYRAVLIPSLSPVGKECILSQGHWFTPTDFERFAGKEHCKNWKTSIRCINTPLKKLIEVNNASTYRFLGFLGSLLKTRICKLSLVLLYTYFTLHKYFLFIYI